MAGQGRVFTVENFKEAMRGMIAPDEKVVECVNCGTLVTLRNGKGKCDSCGTPL